MPFRRKGPQRLEGDFQRLRREIREELGRLRAGLPLERERSREREPEGVRPEPDETPAPPVISHAPERSHVPLRPRPSRSEPVASASISASPLIQKAALGQMEGAPETPTERAANGAPRPVGNVVPSFLTIRQTTLHLEAVATRLENVIGRLAELTMWLSSAAHPEASQSGTAEPARTERAEPRFDPRSGTVTLTITDVPSLQNLMRVGRALSDLAAVADASVAGYEHGSAVLHLTLVGSIGLNDLMQGIREATTLKLLVEESRPEASRLRLRFVAPKPRAEILRIPTPHAVEEAAEAPAKSKRAQTRAKASAKRNGAPAKRTTKRS